jgi:hypothetical protein
MRYYLDTEFDEDKDHLVLLSFALRAADGRELYLVSTDFSTATCTPWVQANVLPHLHALASKGDLQAAYLMSKDRFAEQIELFLCNDGSPEFWGYYCAYDWFLFCRLWGGILRMPNRFPKVCYDLEQLAGVLLPGVSYKSDNPPEQPEHNALADARWNDQLFRWILEKADAQAERDGHQSPELRRGVDSFISNARFTK